MPESEQVQGILIENTSASLAEVVTGDGITHKILQTTIDVQGDIAGVMRVQTKGETDRAGLVSKLVSFGILASTRQEGAPTERLVGPGEELVVRNEFTRDRTREPEFEGQLTFYGDGITIEADWSMHQNRGQYQGTVLRE